MLPTSVADAFDVVCVMSRLIPGIRRGIQHLHEPDLRLAHVRHRAGDDVLVGDGDRPARAGLRAGAAVDRADVVPQHRPRAGRLAHRHAAGINGHIAARRGRTVVANVRRRRLRRRLRDVEIELSGIRRRIQHLHEPDLRLAHVRHRARGDIAVGDGDRPARAGLRARAAVDRADVVPQHRPREGRLAHRDTAGINGHIAARRGRAAVADVRRGRLRRRCVMSRLNFPESPPDRTPSPA